MPVHAVRLVTHAWQNDFAPHIAGPLLNDMSLQAPGQALGVGEHERDENHRHKKTHPWAYL